MKKFFSIFLILVFTFGIAEAKTPVVNVSALDIRALQTRVFDTSDDKKVVKAVINTLQDNGFIIQSVEPELGHIRAKKEVKLKRTDKGRVSVYSTCLAINTAALALSFGANPSAILGMVEDSIRISNEVAPHTVIFDSNVNIHKIGNKTKVRFNVIEKVLENADGYTTVKSSPRKVVRHYEAEIYQEFFNQVAKSLFLEQAL